MTRKILAAAAAALLAAPVAASAQTQSPPPAQAEAAQKRAEKAQGKHAEVKPQQVFTQLHQINQHETAMAELAQKKAQSPEVKAAARTILEDHRQMDEQLMQMAKEQHMELRPMGDLTDRSLADAHQSQMQALEKLSGAKFDTAFIAGQSFAHRFALSVIENGAPAIKDQKGKKMLDTAKQKVTSHLETAEQLLESRVRVAQEPGQTGGG